MEGTMRFPVSAGIAVRGQVKRAIHARIHTLGLDFDVKEDKGWFESMLYYTVRGPEEKLLRLKKDLENWNP